MPAVPFLTARPVSLRSDLARSQKERNVAWPIPNLRKKRAREDSQERADSAAWLGATDAPLPSLDPPQVSPEGRHKAVPSQLDAETPVGATPTPLPCPRLVNCFPLSARRFQA